MLGLPRREAKARATVDAVKVEDVQGQQAHGRVRPRGTWCKLKHRAEGLFGRVTSRVSPNLLEFVVGVRPNLALKGQSGCVPTCAEQMAAGRLESSMRGRAGGNVQSCHSWRRQPTQVGRRARHGRGGDSRLTEGVYTKSALKSSCARIERWNVRAAKRGLQPFPLDAQKLTLAGALPKRGGYRSAKQCLYSLKKQHVCEGGVWDAGLASGFKGVKRSCERGLGVCKQAEALPLSSVAQRGAYTGLHLANAEGRLSSSKGSSS